MVGAVSQWLTSLTNRFQLDRPTTDPFWRQTARIVPVSVVDIAGTSGLKPVLTKGLQQTSEVNVNPGIGVNDNLTFPNTGVYDCKVKVSYSTPVAVEANAKIQVLDPTAGNVIHEWLYYHSGLWTQFEIEFAVFVASGSFLYIKNETNLAALNTDMITNLLAIERSF